MAARAMEMEEEVSANPCRPIVKLIGEDGNAFNILGRVRRALENECGKEVAEQYLKEAMDGDYNHLLAVTQKYVEVV